MWHIQDGKFGDALGMQQSGAPCDSRAPIVTGEKDFLLPKLIRDGDNVRDQFGQCVSGDAPGLAAEVVSTLVGYDDAKSRCRQRLDLFAPSIPEFREAMKKHNDGAVFRSSHNGV